VIPNIVQLSASLHRDPAEVTKFFGTELGAQTTWSADTERAVVNGAHTTPDLQTNLFKYIERFVLCPHCRLPETSMVSSMLYISYRNPSQFAHNPSVYKVKDSTIFSTCAACGTKESLDMTHKLTTFILAQNKKLKDAKKAEEKKSGKKEKGKAKVNVDVCQFTSQFQVLFARIVEG
jgi:translation initiation factor 5